MGGKVAGLGDKHVTERQLDGGVAKDHRGILSQ